MFKSINQLTVFFQLYPKKDIFDQSFSNETVWANVEATNDEHGGLTPAVTNVIYVNGDIDPWARLSILTPIGEKTYTELVPDSFHCADIYSNAAGDSPEMRAARAKITEVVGQWIRE